MFIANAASARFEIAKTVTGPHGMSVRIDQAGNNRAPAQIDRARCCSPPFRRGANPREAVTGDGKRSILDDGQLAHLSAVLRTGAGRSRKLRDAGDQQIGIHARLGMSSPRSRATCCALA